MGSTPITAPSVLEPMRHDYRTLFMAERESSGFDSRQRILVSNNSLEVFREMV
jgi:hypothetical protein